VLRERASRDGWKRHTIGGMLKNLRFIVALEEAVVSFRRISGHSSEVCIGVLFVKG